MTAFADISKLIIFPVLSCTQRKIVELAGVASFELSRSIGLIEQVSCPGMLLLEYHTGVIPTDSRGMQKEGDFFGVPCATLRPETGWIETARAGRIVVVGAEPGRTLDAISSQARSGSRPALSGDGDAAYDIVGELNDHV